ncbi:MAG: hypothetical protein ABSE76_01670 [Minisyncoccia bacterium]|jgi:hypothetical protein
MADSTNSDEIQKLIDALPPEVKALLYSPQMDAVIQQIGTKHQLHIDQIGELESEVAAAMIGISQLQELPQNISDTLEVDMTKSNAIVADINLLLLDKIRDAMKKTDNGKSVIVSSAMAASAAAPAGAPSAPIAPTPAPAPLSTDMQIDAPATSAPAKAATPAPQMPEADVMLSEPTVSLPPVAKSPEGEVKKVDTGAMPAPVAPKINPAPAYKADPYREPID